MKDSFGNSFTKTLATTALAIVTLLLFITAAFAGGKLGGFSAYLPLIILATSSLSISSIWLFGRPRKADSISAKKLATLEQRVVELEERINNAEIVDNFESRLAKKEAQLRAANSHTDQLSCKVSHWSSPKKNQVFAKMWSLGNIQHE